MNRRLPSVIVSATIFGTTAAAAVAPFIAAPPIALEGMFFDLSLAAAAHFRADEQDAREANIVVVAVDRRTLDAPELEGLPRTLFGPAWAVMLDALREADAKAIAFDMILGFSGDRLQPGFDRAFLRSLSNAKDLVVLARSSSTLPVRNYLAALRFDETALGLAELAPDSDGIHRRIRLRRTDASGAVIPSLVGAALRRGGVVRPEHSVIPAPTHHEEDLPTYSLVDVLRCATSDPATLNRAFAGTLVFVGTTLAEEDRKRTSARFLSRRLRVDRPAGGCELPSRHASPPGAETVPGVFVHAAAAAAVLKGSLVTVAAKPWAAAAAVVAALAGTLAGLFLAPLAAAAVAVVVAAAAWAMQIFAIGHGLWLEVTYAVLAIFIATAVAYVGRYLVEDRRRRQIQRAFGRYLAPSLVDRLAEEGSELRLGGEQRDLTVMFADLSGFTALSGRVPPQELVHTTNQYLKLIADAVDATGGYVDKFIGDAVMAIWGAPASDDANAHHAVEAGLRISDAIIAKRAADERAGAPSFDVKIGINSGPAIVGNVGSENRYNYTAVGEAVNIAARLEGLPGVYRCRVVVGPDTEKRLRDVYQFRELDVVSVKGKAESLRIYEPLGVLGDEAREPAPCQRYAEALRLYRAGRFRDAHDVWRSLASEDGPSAVMAERAAAYAESPPPADWDGVFAVAKT